MHVQEHDFHFKKQSTQQQDYSVVDLLKCQTATNDVLVRPAGLAETAQLILVRGLPGSGKSTVARTLTLIGYMHFEADMYFMLDGQYRYDANRIRDAHAWCQGMTRETLIKGQRVVVSNTFTRKQELDPYLVMSQSIRIVEAQGRWNNVHGVPADRVRQMRDRWEPVESAIQFS